MRDISSAFGSLKRNGSGWLAHCPAHPDKVRSLSIHCRGGRWLVRCFAGCTAEAIVSAVGLTMADLSPEARGRNADSSQTYFYF